MGRSWDITNLRRSGRAGPIPSRRPGGRAWRARPSGRAVRCVNAWLMQITPHFSVPSATQKRTGSTSAPPAAGTRRAARRGRRSRRPASGRPKRHDFTHSQPRSSTGSPRCASSQSSTARMPSAPTMRLPLRKSPCTSVGAGGSAGCAGRASAARARTSGAARRTRRGVRGTGRVARGVLYRQRRQRRGGERVDARRDLAALAGEERVGRRRTRRRAGCGAGSSRPRSAPSRTRAEPVVRLEQRTSARHRHAARAAASQKRDTPSSGRVRPMCAPGSRRSTRACRSPPAATASNDHVSRDAPPDKRRSPCDRHRLSEMATDRRREPADRHVGGHGAER